MLRFVLSIFSFFKVLKISLVNIGRDFMSKFLKFKAEVVPGKCPTCEEHTLLVGLTKEYYRCMTCGTDLEQHVNGKISYIPTLSAQTTKSELDKYFNGKES